MPAQAASLAPVVLAALALALARVVMCVAAMPVQRCGAHVRAVLLCAARLVRSLVALSVLPFRIKTTVWPGPLWAPPPGSPHRL